MSNKIVTVYLHIGLNKAGSTSLKYFLSNNRDILLSHEYLYPITGTLEMANLIKITTEYHKLLHIFFVSIHRFY